MNSLRRIREGQATWAREKKIPSERADYASTLDANLFLGDLTAPTRSEFEQADGSELHDSRTSPAKMRAFASSSALAVNFFDPWRHVRTDALARALQLPEPLKSLRFEYICRDYPVKPGSPNLDVLLTTASGAKVAIESKFAEPYRRSGDKSVLSEKYFPAGAKLWENAGLPHAQKLADEITGRWKSVDAPQLLKHLLGLRSEGSADRVHLLYLWYDTGLEDAKAHRSEIAEFSDAVGKDEITFRATSYQELFETLVVSGGIPSAEWAAYMRLRYFAE